MTPITPEDLNLPRAIPRPARMDWRIGMIGYADIASIKAGGAWIPV